MFAPVPSGHNNAMQIRTLAAFAAIVIASPAAAQTAANRGATLVQRHCAACHAIGPTGESPNAKAPTLREIARKYRPQDLEEAFAEGIMVSHEGQEMPPFTFDPPEITALTAYLRSLRGAKP
jgi:cytochrome c